MSESEQFSGMVTFEKVFGSPTKSEPNDDNLEAIFSKTFPFSLISIEEINNAIAPDNLENAFQITTSPINRRFDKQNSYILIQGSILIYSIGDGIKKGNKEPHSAQEQDQGKEESGSVIETITNYTYFGYECSLLGQEIYKYVASKESSIIEILPNYFDKLIGIKTKTFQIAIFQNIFHKCKILKPILKVQRFIQASVRENHELDVEKLKGHYLKLKSLKHSFCNDKRIDFSALEYALSILPDEIISAQKIFFTTKDNSYSYEKVKMDHKKRRRNIFKIDDDRQLLVILENYETDICDFLSVLLIVIIEVEKIQNLIKTQISTQKDISIFDIKSFDNLNIGSLNSDLLSPLQYIFKKVVGTVDASQGTSKIVEAKVQVQDYFKAFLKKITLPHFKFFPVISFEENSFDCRNNRIEEWSQKLWDGVLKFIDQFKTIDKSKKVSSKELINKYEFHIIIASKRGLMKIVDPFIYKHKDDITKYGNTKDNPSDSFISMVNEEDLFTVYAQEYLDKCLTEKLRLERNNSLLESGIVELQFNNQPLDPSVVLIDPAKLNPEYISASLKPTISKNKAKYPKMIFICLSYSYGVRSKEIAKQLFLLFGKSIKSFSLLGKATCLSKEPKLLFAKKIINYETSEAISVSTSQINPSDLVQLSKKNVEMAKLLTLNVRVFQNDILLRYYGKVLSCIAGEMEAFYYAKQIQQLKDNNLTDPNLSQTYGFFIEEDIQSEGVYYTQTGEFNPNFSKVQVRQDFNTGFIELSALYIFIIKQITKLSKYPY